jgi:serine/threonine protein kinase
MLSPTQKKSSFIHRIQNMFGKKKSSLDETLTKYEFDKNYRCIKGGTSVVYVDKNKQKIIKYFGKSTSLLKDQNIQNETDALNFCAQCLPSDVQRHIPKLYEQLGDCIVLEYKGDDAIDLINKNDMNTEIFITFLADVTFVLSHLHLNNITHGDIKLENVCWDGEKWNLIDFGFSYPIDTTLKRRQKHGTFPFIFPGYGNKSILETFVANNKDMSIRIAADWYAFALTALIFLGFDYYECDDRSFINYEIADVIYFYEKKKKDNVFDIVIGSIAAIVLSIIDTDMETLQWCRRSGTCEYIGRKVRNCQVNKDTCACINIYMENIKKLYNK